MAEFGWLRALIKYLPVGYKIENNGDEKHLIMSSPIKNQCNNLTISLKISKLVGEKVRRGARRDLLQSGQYDLLEKVFPEKPLNGLMTVRLSLATLKQ